MPKDAAFTLKLEPQLRAAFMAAVAHSRRPASQVLRDLMWEFVRQQHHARMQEAELESRTGLEPRWRDEAGEPEEFLPPAEQPPAAVQEEPGPSPYAPVAAALRATAWSMKALGARQESWHRFPVCFSVYYGYFSKNPKAAPEEGPR